MELSNKHEGIIVLIFGILPIIIIETGFGGSKGLYIYAIIIYIIIIVLLGLYALYLIMKNDGVAYFFERFLGYIFLIAFFLTILLTILLLNRMIPDYLSSIYVLFGSLMVAVVGIYLNKKLDVERETKKRELNVEKENRKIKRLTSIINNEISSNKTLAEAYLTVLSEIESYSELKHLKKSYWDILSSNITEIDLDSDFVQSLISLKELSFEINDLIKERQDYLNNFIEGSEPPRFSCEEDIVTLHVFNRTIIKASKELIKESEEYLKEYM